MKKIYVSFLLVMGLLLSAAPVSAQVSEGGEPQELNIEGLSIYPNPATGDKVFITTKKENTKQVEVYNALGKIMLSSKMSGNELNISTLESGVYILKIKEGNRTATRKLVIR